MTVMATIYSYRDPKMKALYTLEGAVIVDLGLDDGSSGQFSVDEFKFLPDEITENVGGFDVPPEELGPKESVLKAARIPDDEINGWASTHP